MQTSANYGLKLFEGTDNVKRQDFVDNFQKIDNTMKSIDNNKAPSGYGLGTAATDISGKDLSNIVSTGFYRGSGIINAPNSGWFWFIVEGHSDSNWVSQKAISYGSGNNANITYTRVKTNGAWSSWSTLYSTSVKPLPIDIGAMPKSIISSPVDFNTITTTGIYSVCFSNGANQPTANHGTLVVDFNVGTPNQLWYPDNVVNAIYKRFYSSGAWIGWTNMLSLGNLGASPNAHTHDDRYYTESEINTKVDALNNTINGKASTNHNHTLSSLTEKSYNSLTDKPTSLPANGGNADTVDGKHASDFVPSHIVFDNDPSVNIDSYNSTATWIGKVGDKVANRPTFADWCTVLNIGSSNNSNFQIGGTFDGTNRIGYRCRHDTDSVYGGWKRILNEDDYNALYNLANNSKVSECVPTTLNGWALGYHFCVTRIGNTVTISGSIRPGTLANEPDIFQLPNGFKPYADSDYVALCPHLNNDTRQNSLVYFRVLTSGRCFYIGSNPAITNGGNTEIKLEFTYRGV